MKKFLMSLAYAAVLLLVVSCGDDNAEEARFIDEGRETIQPPKENPYWESADAFPGPVNVAIPRTGGIVVPIKGGFEPLAFSPKTPVLISTGLYVGLDEPVTIEVPAHAVNLKCQIGTVQPLLDITIQTAQRRNRDVTTRYDLVSGETNPVSSYFGGYLYFYYEPEDVPAPGSPNEVVEVVVNNVVESYDFIYGETNVLDFARTTKERSQKILDKSIGDDQLDFLLWTELRSDKVILTFGMKEMQYMANAERLLDTYGNMRDAYYEFAGFSTENQPPMRVASDIQLPNANQKTLGANNARRSPGYPIGVWRKDQPREDSWEDERRAVNEALQLDFVAPTNWMAVPYSFGVTVLGDWATGSWMQFPLLRVANLYYARTKLNVWWPTNYRIDFAKYINENKFVRFKDTRHYSAVHRNSFHTQPNTNSPYGNGGGEDGKVMEYETRFATMFVQLAEEYGWPIFAYVNQRAIELEFVNEYQQDCYDFFAMAACEYTNTNLMPFFQWWKYPLTEYAQTFMKEFPALAGENLFLPGATSKYFFDTNDFPSEPDIPMTNPHNTVPVKKEWGPKPYFILYSKVANQWNADATVAQGAKMQSGIYDGVTNLRIGAPNNHGNMFDNVLNNASQYSHIAGAGANAIPQWKDRPASGDTLLNYNYIEIDFKQDYTFNALEIMQAGTANEVFQWTFDVEVFAKDEEFPDGHWVWVDENRPTVTGDWYNGVYWAVNHINNNDNDKNRYTLYMPATYTASRMAIKVHTSVGDRRNNSGTGVAAKGIFRLREIDIGLISTDIPQESGTEPFPYRSWFSPAIRSVDL